MQSQTSTYGGTSTARVRGDKRSGRKKVALALFWVGLLVAAAFAGVVGWELTRNLRTLTSEEFRATIWGFDGPLFMLWAFSVPLGSVLAGTGAFLYARTKRAFVWLTGIAVLGIVNAVIAGRTGAGIYNYNLALQHLVSAGVLLVVFWIYFRMLRALAIRLTREEAELDPSRAQ